MTISSKLKEYFEKMKEKEATYIPPKKRVYTEVTMRMAHFHDFYYLQAMQAGLKIKLAQNDELQFSKAVEKLQENLDKVCEKVFPNIALRTFMYLYAACLGEARHANDSLAEFRYIPETVQNKRETLFCKVAEYAPTDENIQAIINTFDQNWRSGYGGSAWLEISKALKEFNKLPPAAFVDHVIDLEHNNGTVFSKPDGLTGIHFDVSYDGRFSTFLDYKFRCNILKQQGYMRVLDLSPRVYYLLEKYCTILHEKMPTWVTGNLENLDDYTVEWGEGKLECEEKWCKWVNVQSGNEPNADVLWDMAGFAEISVSNTTEKGLKKHIVSCKKNAQSLAGKFMTPKVKKELNQKIKDFYKISLTKCRPSAIKETFKILPVKVKRLGSQLIFQVPVDFCGIGEKKDYGFSLITNNHGIYLPTGKDSGFDGDKEYHNAYLSHPYCGNTFLHIGTDKFDFSNSKLEAILE